MKYSKGFTFWELIFASLIVFSVLIGTPIAFEYLHK